MWGYNELFQFQAGKAYAFGRITHLTQRYCLVLLSVYKLEMFLNVCFLLPFPCVYFVRAISNLWLISSQKLIIYNAQIETTVHVNQKQKPSIKVKKSSKPSFPQLLYDCMTNNALSWSYLFKAGSSAGLGWNQYTGKGFWPQKRSITGSNSKCQVLLLKTMDNQLNWGVGGSIGLVWCNCRCLEVILF